MQNKICLGGIDNDNIGQGVNTITNKQCQPLGEKIEWKAMEGHEFVHMKHETSHFL